MVEMICAIPEEIGWALVGFALATCAFMAYQLGKTLVQMYKERKAESCSEVAA